MEQTFIAKTLMGLEEVLAAELTALGAHDVQQGRRMVAFRGDKELLYRANFALRTATRILLPLRSFAAHSADDVYKEVYAMPWEDYLERGQTFAVDAVTYSDTFTNSHYVAYKVKDAVVDHCRAATGQRPNISVANPDLQLHIHIAGDEATLSLDSSGESLHRRGYRQESVEAPLNEVLAAGILLLAGWQGDTDFVDPMCGSGTFLIEAALIARNMAPGLYRQHYAFERWRDFDAALLQQIYDDDSRERPFHHHIYGYDCDARAVAMSINNIRGAALTHDITVRQQDFKDFEQPRERTLLVMNPPYGERMSTPNLLGTYKMIGERLKHAFRGNEAWILSYKEACFHQIGLKPSVKIALTNGALPCTLHKYQLFEGAWRTFRHDGGQIKDAPLSQHNSKKKTVAKATHTARHTAPPTTAKAKARQANLNKRKAIFGNEK